MPCSEECEYRRSLQSVVRSWSPTDALPTDDMLYAIDRPFPSFYLLFNFDRWICCVDFKILMRTRSSRRIFALWHNVEISALHLPISTPFHVYMTAWWCVLGVRTTCTFRAHQCLPTIHTFRSVVLPFRPSSGAFPLLNTP